MFGATMLYIVYGIKVAEKNDRYIEIAEKAMQEATGAFSQGEFWVDSVPVLKYVPAWMPGAGFQRKAAQWKIHTTAIREAPWRTVAVSVELLAWDLLQIIDRRRCRKTVPTHLSLPRCWSKFRTSTVRLSLWRRKLHRMFAQQRMQVCRYSHSSEGFEIENSTGGADTVIPLCVAVALQTDCSCRRYQPCILSSLLWSYTPMFRNERKRSQTGSSDLIGCLLSRTEGIFHTSRRCTRNVYGGSRLGPLLFRTGVSRMMNIRVI